MNFEVYEYISIVYEKTIKRSYLFLRTDIAPLSPIQTFCLDRWSRAISKYRTSKLGQGTSLYILQLSYFISDVLIYIGIIHRYYIHLFDYIINVFLKTDFKYRIGFKFQEKGSSLHKMTEDTT